MATFIAFLVGGALCGVGAAVSGWYVGREVGRRECRHEVYELAAANIDLEDRLDIAAAAVQQSRAQMLEGVGELVAAVDV